MRVLSPPDLPGALAILADDADTVTPLAGGTDLLVHWPDALERHDRTYVDLTGVAALRESRWTPNEFVLGGGTTYWDVSEDPRARAELSLLAQAAGTVGAIQIQTRGTWAGNIVNASPAADGVPVLMAYDAEIVLASATGERRVRLDAFYSGYKRMDRRPGELVTAIHLPRRTYDHQAFVKVGSRRAQAITKVGIAVAHSSAGWRVVANSVAPTVRRLPRLEAMLEERVPVHAAEDFGAALRADVAPIDDVRSTAAYRSDVLARILYHTLRSACDWIDGPAKGPTA